MDISIIGSGHIGAGLARAWRAKGHAVTFGARDPRDAELVALCTSIGATATTVAAAVAPARVVVFAMPYGALDDVLTASGDLAGKVVIDCTNAVERGAGLKYGHTTSSAEELQRRIPTAHVVKSFNAQGAENLAKPIYGDLAASNFYCGDDAAAKQIVRQLVEDVGFDAIDAGPLASARLIEPLMMLWMASSRAVGSRDIAFRVLRR
ncbi:MAG: NAD(P)-binding domain-containing protein [Myxococcales bacterium]|nr:NAD(P)-binding domain-containing protein [Myxococcales bacterium]